LLLDLLFFCAGAIFAVALLHSIGKALMAKKNQVDFQEKFDHNNRHYTLMGKNLNMGTERFVVGPLRGLRPDYAAAEWGLINSTMVKLLCDGETIWKTGDDIEKLPYENDPETGYSTGDKLLRVLVTRRFPKLAEDHDEPFGTYYDEDELENGASPGPQVAGPGDQSPKPTLISPGGPTE
jgi:hypothetical protein